MWGKKANKHYNQSLLYPPRLFKRQLHCSLQAFGKSHSCPAERTVHFVCLRLQFLFSKRKHVQLLTHQWGAFQNCFMSSLFQMYFCFWSMEWPLDHRRDREILEHPAFYLQGHGQSPPLSVKFIFLHLISFSTVKGAYAVEKIVSVFTQLFSRTQENRRTCRVLAITS